LCDWNIKYDCSPGLEEGTEFSNVAVTVEHPVKSYFQKFKG